MTTWEFISTCCGLTITVTIFYVCYHLVLAYLLR